MPNNKHICLPWDSLELMNYIQKRRMFLFCKALDSCVRVVATMLVILSSTHGRAEDSKVIKTLKTSERCGYDLYEPNNRRSRARNLSAELKGDREISARVCAGDQDWYTVWINRGEMVEFVISSPLEIAPYISIFAPRKRKASGILRTSAPSSRRLRVYAKQSGRYRLHVRPRREAPALYTLSLHRPAH